MDNSLIYGKDSTKSIVSIEILNDEILLFLNDGSVKRMPNKYWIITNKKYSDKWTKLEGELEYKYIRFFATQQTFYNIRKKLYSIKADFHAVTNPVEAAMIINGFTLFKGLKVNDVSVLSFDIETTGLTHDENSKVLLISNTFRKDDEIIKELFSIDEYEDDKEMLEDWCKWVQKMDPTILLGHNIFSYDIPYMNYCLGKPLEIGRDCSPLKMGNPKYPKKFRVDGNRDIEYLDIRCFGRQIIDTMFLAIRYDFKRAYVSYGLKPIIKHEGLEKKDREFWDFEERSIYSVYLDRAKNRKLWEKAKQYAMDDADDSLALYDLMIPSYFYYMQHIPMDFQMMHQTATGRQINNFLVRAYLQENHSIPKVSEQMTFGGGLSLGNPGIYKHVYKVDVASLYPSIMITENIYDRDKDPKAKFQEMVQHFTKERLMNKQKGKETGDRYYKDIEQSQKIFINSAYGLLGTPGLNFNSFHNADKVTTTGREILRTGMKWVEEKGFKLSNVDTDSFSYTTGKKLSDEEFEAHIKEINTLFKEGIVWEDDGYYPKFIVLAAKNYIKYTPDKKIKTTGSGLRDQKREMGLRKFIDDVIQLLLDGKKDRIFFLYNEYAKKIKNIENIDDWCKKVTVTKKMMESERVNEQSLFNAIKTDHYQEGDKKWVFVEEEIKVGANKNKIWKLQKDFCGKYHEDSYLKKLHSSLGVFKNVVDIDMIPDYTLKRNKDYYNGI
jgi:DNA polymerase elongation subunit (family B)